MKITIENYEAYALDYLEGSLGEREGEAFQSFLEQHPEIQEELAGLELVSVIPDIAITYPDKVSLYQTERKTIIPLWNSRWMVAAGIALFLGVATIFYINQSTAPQSPSYTSQQPNTNTQLPASKPMPAEQPETDVMAQKGNDSGRSSKTDERSPALNLEELTPTTEDLSENNSIIEREIELTYEETQAPLTTLESPKVEIESRVLTASTTEARSIIQPVKEIAFLPALQNHIDIPSATRIPSTTWNTPDGSTQFEIRIPGDFLSETWTDVSLTNLKNKLLPEFLNSRNNK